jgi:ParB-like chromosome segregation protein Spo0J
MKNRDIKLKTYDDIFNVIESLPENDIKFIDINVLLDFRDHPFKVIENKDMDDLLESIKANGILVPVLVRPVGGKYEIISGHRRKFCAVKAGFKQVPCVIRDMSYDEAVLAMVDSNIQRKNILPSEKAFSYKMKLNAIKRQGERTDLTSRQVDDKLEGSLTSRQVDDKLEGDLTSRQVDDKSEGDLTSRQVDDKWEGLTSRQVDDKSEESLTSRQVDDKSGGDLTSRQVDDKLEGSLTSRQLDDKWEGLTSRQGDDKSAKLVGNDDKKSERTVQRYIRLTELTPFFLDAVDAKKLSLGAAIDLSYLSKDEQNAVEVVVKELNRYPSLEQAKKLRDVEMDLTQSCIIDILTGALKTYKPEPKEEKITIELEKIRRYFPDGYTLEAIEETIIELIRNNV